MSTKKVAAGGKAVKKSGKEKRDPLTDGKAAGSGEPGEDGYDFDAGLDMDSTPYEVTRKPANQLPLTEDQLKEVFSRSITATNPNAPKNIVRLNYLTDEFTEEKKIDHLTVHFSMESILMHVDSKEAQEEKERYGLPKDEAMPVQVAQSGTQTKADEEEEDDDGDLAGLLSSRALKNQFNFSGRASQTYINPMRDREVATEPPPTKDFEDNVSQMEIFDAYKDDLDKQIAARSKSDKKQYGKGDDDKQAEGVLGGAPVETGPVSATETPAFAAAVKIMERLVNQNAETSTYQEYKFSMAKPETGKESGLPSLLWTFGFKSAERKNVTAISWNAAYPDLFAAGYGSYDFVLKSRRDGKEGMVCCFTLKNTSYPEAVFYLDSGVMCLDWHPSKPFLLAAGLYDGAVAVVDMRNKNGQPLYVADNPKTKHTDPVWEVKWAKEEAGKGLGFYAVSSDGRVTQWIINKNELVPEELTELKLTPKKDDDELSSTTSASAGAAATAAAPAVSSPTAGGDSSAAPAAAAAGLSSTGSLESKDGKERPASASASATATSTSLPAPPAGEDAGSLVNLAGGCCFDFNKAAEHLFVVGTEEGALQLYSKAYNCQLLQSYEGHHMAVYTVRWNPFHPRVFLSASADWSVKLWEFNTHRPVMTFDMSNSVADVAWAPYSATMFACITTDNHLRVFDLSVAKHEPLVDYPIKLVQPRVKDPSKKLRGPRVTHLCFNPREPVILVGDDNGTVYSFKLTGALRKMSATLLEDIEPAEEMARLDKLLIMPDDAGPADLLALINAAKAQLLRVPTPGAQEEASAAEGAGAEGAKAAAQAAAPAAEGAGEDA